MLIAVIQDREGDCVGVVTGILKPHGTSVEFEGTGHEKTLLSETLTVTVDVNRKNHSPAN